jgi:hypothetical protein
VGAQDSWSDVPDLLGEAHVWVVRSPDGRQASAPASVSQIAKGVLAGRLSADVEVRHIRSVQWETVGAFLGRMQSPSPNVARPITATSAFKPLANVPEVTGVDASRTSVRLAPLGGLLDFGFTTFVTTKMIRVLFGGVLLMALGTLLTGVCFGLTAIASAFTASRGGPSGLAILLGVAKIAAGGVGAVSIVVLGRVALELVVATFRISETLTEIKAKLR